MELQVACPQCGKEYVVTHEQWDRSARCAKCGERFSISAENVTGASSDDTRMPAKGSGESDASHTPSQAPADDVPEQIGRFEIKGRLGMGGFGAVYQAYDPVLDREVAVKVPRPAVLASDKARARFLREPKAAAQLRHPNIVPVYDAGTDGDQYYIASAYIEGRTLDELIEEERPDFRRSAEIVRQLAAALKYAHDLGIIHRDVKPSNVMIDPSGDALLMDFGLARIEQTEEQLTQDGAVMGTPAYMAPEQAEGERYGDVGPASDQYSLGVVLYELLCGDRPFNGPPSVVIFNTLNNEPESPREKNAAIPRDLETICLKAMSKESDARYADCDELADDLRRWLEDEPIRARRLGLFERAVRWSKRNPLPASLALAVVAALTIGVTGIVWQWGRAESNLAAADRAREQAEHNLQEAQTQQQRAETAQTGLAQALEQSNENLLKAQQEERRAKDALDKAEKERLARTKSDEEAKRQRKKAAESGTEAQRLRGVVDDTAKRHLYRRHMNAVGRELQAGDAKRARDLLELYGPESDNADLRSFEWYNYWRRVDTPRPYATNVRVLSMNGHFGAGFGKTKGELVICDAATGQIRKSIDNTKTEWLPIAISNDGKTVACQHKERAQQHYITLVDVASSEKLLTIPVAKPIAAFSPRGSTFISWSKTGVTAYDVNTRKEVWSRRLSPYGRQFDFSPDGRVFAVSGFTDASGTANRETGILILDAASGAPQRTIESADEIVFAPDGATYLALVVRRREKGG